MAAGPGARARAAEPAEGALDGLDEGVRTLSAIRGAEVNGPEAIVAVVVFTSIGLTVLTLARAYARRIAGGGVGGSKDVEALRDEVAQLRAEVDELHGRVAPLDEIQNRLDFTERLLAQARERGLLNAPKER